MIGGVIRQLRNNLGAVVLALLLAFVIWIAASLQTDPFEERRIGNIPVVRVHQPADTQFLSPPVEQVAVVARARASVFADLRTASFQAVLDLSGVVPGQETTVPISVTTTNDLVRIQRVEPQEQPISLVLVRTITFPVTIDVGGEVATGFEAGAPIVAPASVTVRGPSPTLERVVVATGQMRVEGARRPVTQTVFVRLLDAQGQVVLGVQTEPEAVEVVVPVRSLAQYKPDVEVVPDLRGEVAPGYRRGAVTVEPATVTLEGPSAVLNRLPGFIETMPITITGATETITRRSPLTVPVEVSVVEVSLVTVTVEVLPILTTRSMTATVEMLRVPAGMRAVPRPNAVIVTLQGPDARVAALRAEELLVVLDLRLYPRGVHRIVPDVLVPAGILVLNVEPRTVEVTIDLIPTPTPTPPDGLTPTPTPTATPRPI